LKPGGASGADSAIVGVKQTESVLNGDAKAVTGCNAIVVDDGCEPITDDGVDQDVESFR
jgi:hypothetical protein